MDKFTEAKRKLLDAIKDVLCCLVDNYCDLSSKCSDNAYRNTVFEVSQQLLNSLKKMES